MDNFEYDKISFLKNCMASNNREVEKLTKTQLIANLTIDYHRIEKGLAMQNTRPNFGQRSQVLKRLYDMNREYLHRCTTNSDDYTDKDKILSIVYDCIAEYLDWHLERKIECKCKYIKHYLAKYSYLKNTQKLGGTVKMTAKELKNDVSASDSFFYSRRSVREYSTMDIDLNDIKECVRKSLYGTPTVCNRPINKVYIVKDKAVKKKILSMQNGNRGFGNFAPVILVVTTDLENFQDADERKQPYIGGGMFCMSLIYALHADGFASCALNWDVPYEKEDKLKKILNMGNDAIMMFIAVGNYADEFVVAQSEKLNEDEIINIF